MAERSLSTRVRDVLDLASRPLTAAEIRRWMPEDVTPEELSSCLIKMRGRNEILHSMTDRRALTGPRKVKAYFLPTELGN